MAQFNYILRNTAKIVVPLLCAGAILVYFYGKMDMVRIGEILRSGIDYGWILVTLVIAVFSHIFRALRWRLQLRSLGISPSLRTATNAIFGTYGMNMLFPRLGEVWRCGYVARHEGASFTQVLGSVFSDRLSDTVMVVLITLSAFFSQMSVFRGFLAKFPQIEAGVVSLLTSPLLYGFVVGAAVVLVWTFSKKPTNRLVVKIKEQIQNLWEGFATVLRMPHKYFFLLYTLLIWSCYFMQLYLVFFAFEWSQNFSPLVALALFAMGSLSMGVPVQGGLGAWHVAIIATLALYGVDNTDAGAFALIAHGSQMALNIVLGLFALCSILLQKRGNNSSL